MKFAHYEFDLKKDLIGAGQSSQVYRAKDLSLDRIVALKILEAHVTIDPEASERFKREAVHTADLNHPNIATVFTFDTTQIEGQKRSYIAMEFLEGTPLDKIIKQLDEANVEYEGPFAYPDAIPLKETIRVFDPDGNVLEFSTVK